QPIHLAGNPYGAGQVAYGPIGTPLELSGTGLGFSGSVLFVPYNNGSPVPAVTTLWSTTSIKFTVPENAISGFVEVVTSGGTSNELPFLVMRATRAYSPWCPATPGGSPVQVDTTALDDGVVNKSYSMHLRASGGTGSYSWSLTSGTLPVGLSLSSSGIISGTPTTTSSPVNITVQVADTSTPSQHASATLGIQIEQQDGTISTAGLYSFQIQAPGSGSGYDSVGNVVNFTDSVNSTWALYYDPLNRLATASESGTSNPYPNYCWQYDNFGNRLWQTSSATPYTSSNGGSNSCPVTSGPSAGASYNANNQISDGLHQYDATGNITADSTTGNSYLYDSEGRICAMQLNVSGTNMMTQYIYDADGHRVAKGTISSWSCDTTSNGFTATTVYVLGPNGEQMTEMTNSSGTWQWKHTNVYAAGQQIATYDVDPGGTTPGPIYFHLSDWLGTRREQTDYAGNPVLNFTGLPYGDGRATVPVSNSSVADATEHPFTGKERDAESGNDYFGARYYSSTMGRFISPNWSAKEEPVPFASFSDPQSLNLYSYVRNNPHSNTDADGHCDIGCQFSIAWGIFQGIQRDGGVGAYSKNVGIGVLKGAGSAVVNTVKLAAAGMNPGAIAAAVLSPGPKTLQPSNTTQAQASFVTQAVLPAAAGMAAGPLLGAAGGAEASAGVRLL